MALSKTIEFEEPTAGTCATAVVEPLEIESIEGLLFILKFVYY